MSHKSQFRRRVHTKWKRPNSLHDCIPLIVYMHSTNRVYMYSTCNNYTPFGWCLVNLYTKGEKGECTPNGSYLTIYILVVTYTTCGRCPISPYRKRVQTKWKLLLIVYFTCNKYYLWKMSHKSPYRGRVNTKWKLPNSLFHLEQILPVEDVL